MINENDFLQVVRAMLSEHGANFTEKELDEKIEQIKKSTKGCVVCAADSYAAAMFVPNSPEDFGAEKGKVRQIYYGICETHFGGGSVECAEKAEEAVLEKLRNGGGNNLGLEFH